MPSFLGFAHTIILADGWQRRLIAFFAGAAGALALAPVDFFPAIALTMTIAVWLIDGMAEAGDGQGRFRPWSWNTLKTAAGTGWWLGFGYFLCGLWWLGAAFLVEADKFAWALPLGVIGLPAFLALFTAFGFVIARLLWSSGSSRIFALGAGLGLSEYLRGTILTGFPWNNFGMAFGGNNILGQGASLVGLHGLTILVIILFASPATLIDSLHDGRQRGFFRRNIVFLSAIILLGGMAAWGTSRLNSGPIPMVAGVKLRIMQPGLRQDAQFTPENGQAILEHYLALSDRATSPQRMGVADVTHLIWPESAFPFILSREPKALAQIASLLAQGTTLITGAASMSETGARGKRTERFFNSILVLGSGGTILDSYDKVHLVPFGEYVPLSGLLDSLGIQQFVHIPGGFEAGAKRKLLNIPGLPPVAPLVCYEAVFPGEVTSQLASMPGSVRPGLLLNVSNDGWFGQTAGPWQHLAQARLRAIEEGLPLVRAANTGISAMVDPYGRLMGTVPLGTEGVLDVSLPKALPPTFFAFYGNLIAQAMLLLAFSIAILTKIYRSRVK